MILYSTIKTIQYKTKQSDTKKNQENISKHYNTKRANTIYYITVLKKTIK